MFSSVQNGDGSSDLDHRPSSLLGQRITNFFRGRFSARSSSSSAISGEYHDHHDNEHFHKFASPYAGPESMSMLISRGSGVEECSPPNNEMLGLPIVGLPSDSRQGEGRVGGRLSSLDEYDFELEGTPSDISTTYSRSSFERSSFVVPPFRLASARRQEWTDPSSSILSTLPSYLSDEKELIVIVHVAASLTPLAALAVGEVAQYYDKSNKTVYAKQHLLNLSASAWLGTEPPKFPYVLSISAGDNPSIVTNKLLVGAKVLGSCYEPTRNTLDRLMLPTSKIFYSRGGMQSNGEDEMMDALLDALRDLRGTGAENAKYRASASKISMTGQDGGHLVFLLRDFDILDDRELERWLRWTCHVLHDELAYVIFLTTSCVTPAKIQRIQERWLASGDFEDVRDFVGILLRPAYGLVDSSSAEEKLRDLSDLHGLDLYSCKHTFETTTAYGDHHGTVAIESHTKRVAGPDYILKTTGNWWSDIDEICQRLKQNNLNDLADEEDRLTLIQDVCSNFVQETQVNLLEALHLDMNLCSRKFPASDKFVLGENAPSTSSETSKALRALECWKCLESVSQMTPVTGGNSLINLPQQILNQKDKTPHNCINPIVALLPFNYRKEGEQKFLDLIDQRVLFLRPKDTVDIGVIPCKSSEIVSPCWVQIRPVMKKAFETIHKNYTYFRIILELDHLAATVEIQEEIELYALQISDRRKVLSDMKRHYKLFKNSMTPAKKATRKAELALMDVELQAKDIYLDKLRSILAP
ncbi:tkl protein kinase [Plasmopara halstedii]|uniref:Tkl protein kinase n=1 Tax=Plasmopara halstedii TaxID=4781 RepID=A0A0P1AM06_PLAHL|nr:tkl protein kinase [Plasmopara halstedii]CEG42030.1 tkl protein kinase [Plasmopara halstedii]|eukprot:XP_024578399.1 tkl protein kinase [Plasmopara halstedii]